MGDVDLSFASPRKLPKARDLRGGVVVLDIAFASDAGSARGFEKTTLPFIESLGTRLRAWVDHHDSDHHVRFADDARFVLATKAQHGACPEMINPALVERVGPVDTIVCHVDFDGLCCGAKWLRGGVEPYPGCDEDARAIDTRIGTPSRVADRIDRAIRARPRDLAMFGIIVRHLASGLADAALWESIDRATAEHEAMEAETRKIARRYQVEAPGIAIVDATGHGAPYDKTLLLMLGQDRARVALVLDRDTATFASAFDSGVNFLKLFDISGGMPTRVSISRSRLPAALRALEADDDVESRYRQD